MKSEDDIKYCKTDGVPNELIIAAEAQKKAEKEPKKQTLTSQSDPERRAELLERYKEE